MPFPLTDAQLNALLDEIPAVAGRPRQLEELSGGLTNRNVKVTTPDAVYVARCTDTSCNYLAIDRDDEYYNSVAAERAGVAAPVIDYRPDLGILLLGFLDGTTLCNEDFQRPGVVAKVAAGCRTLHSGPRFRGRFDMFERLPGLRRRVRSDKTGADRHRSDHRPMQQRSIGGQLHRRRRSGVDYRLRVLR